MTSAPAAYACHLCTSEFPHPWELYAHLVDGHGIEDAEAFASARLAGHTRRDERGTLDGAKEQRQ